MNNKSVSEAILSCPTLNSANVEKLSKIGKVVKFKSGEIIIYDKAIESNFYFVITGVVSLYKLNMYGGKKAIFLLGEGKAINEAILSDEISSIFVKSMSDVTLLSFNRENFNKYLLEDPTTALKLLESMSLKLRRLYHQLKNTCKSYKLDKQIASKLWKLGKDFGISCLDNSQVRIRFKLSINELSDLMGATRESVGRSLKILVGRNLVFTKDGYFFITDIEELRKYSLHPKVN